MKKTKAPLCKCGCGWKVGLNVRYGYKFYNSYIWGHNRRKKGGKFNGKKES